MDPMFINHLTIHRARGLRSNTLLISILSDGQIFQDSYGIKIMQVSHALDRVHLRVEVPDYDTDGDSIPNSIDTDDDNDGIPDTFDCAPLDKSKWRNQAYSDPDSDGVRNAMNYLPTAVCFGATPPQYYTLNEGPMDNCPSVPNTDQLDLNQNGIGDACES